MTDKATLSPEPLLQMTIGFWASKTIMTAVQLDIFTKISGSSTEQVSLDQLQQMTNLERRPSEVFVAALVSLGLLNANISKEKDNQESKNREYLFSNSDLAFTFLDKNKQSYIGDFIIAMDKQFYQKWDHILKSIQTNKPFESSNTNDDTATLSSKELFDNPTISLSANEQLQEFTRAMYGVSVGPAIELSKEFCFTNYKNFMDIGGGSGVYSIQVIRENPHMKATVLDLEPACLVANEYIKKFELNDKIQTKVLDFFKDQIPTGYDVAFLSHIIHQYGKETNVELLKRIFDSLPSNHGAVIISEWFLNDEKTGPVHSALLGLTMILEHSEGRNYTYSEVSEMLTEAGFKEIEQRNLKGPADILIGYKK